MFFIMLKVGIDLTHAKRSARAAQQRLCPAHIAVPGRLIKIVVGGDGDLRQASYRDRKDAYVTKTYDLSEDIDDIYAKLMKFQAQGGGDTPESVNQAIHEAVTKMKWDKDRKVLKKYEFS